MVWESGMDARVQRMLDHFEIRELIEAYVHACDRCDLEGTKDCYWEDSYDHHGPIAGSGWQFATDCIASLDQYWTSCTHHLGQSRIKVDGDSAGVETYYFASLTRDQDGAEMLDLQVGRYVDVIERRDGVWRIKDRRCIQEWAITIPNTGSFVDRASFLPGLRGEEDISFRVLGLKMGNARIDRPD